LYIPLQAADLLAYGEFHECEARTVDLNRHGARIRISRLLAGGETIHVINVGSRREADFRVAGPVSPLTKDGVCSECSDRFPEIQPNANATESNALMAP